MQAGGGLSTPILPLLAALCIVGATLSCSPTARHSVLDFLIDGVPPYLPPEERARVAKEAAEREAEAAAAEKQRRSARYRPVERLSRFVHGPYAARECASCHELQASSGFREVERGLAVDLSSADALAEGGRLRAPLVELCTKCHTEYAPDDPGNAGLWLHGPVGTGWCVTCHEPHSSPHPQLLRASPSARLCGACHLREDLVAFTPEHRPRDPSDAYPPSPPAAVAVTVEGPAPPENVATPSDSKTVQVAKDCVRCHDPHRGPDRFILRERRQPRSQGAPRTADARSEP